uniref:Uncharacterized protein n=1 Tax=Arundo donax TaxID=35708 RepID=A0A0A8YJ33_ARUDO
MNVHSYKYLFTHNSMLQICCQACKTGGSETLSSTVIQSILFSFMGAFSLLSDWIFTLS